MSCTYYDVLHAACMSCMSCHMICRSRSKTHLLMCSSLPGTYYLQVRYTNTNTCCMLQFYIYMVLYLCCNKLYYAVPSCLLPVSGISCANRFVTHFWCCLSNVKVVFWHVSERVKLQSIRFRVQVSDVTHRTIGFVSVMCLL